MTLQQAVKSIKKDSETLKEEHLVKLNRILLESAPTDTISYYIDENVESPAERNKVSPSLTTKLQFEVKSNKIKHA